MRAMSGGVVVRLVGAALVLAAVLARPPAGLGDTPIGTELLKNGDFQTAKGEWVEHWRGSKGASIRREGGKAWLVISGYDTVSQKIRLEPDWMKLRITARMRVTGVVLGKEGWQDARLAMHFTDAQNQHVDPWPNVFQATGTTGWVRYERVFPIPAGAVWLELGPAMLGKAGTVEFDDISVTLARKRSNRKEDLPAPQPPGRLWSLDDAWRGRSATRETICLNGLWRFLPVPDGRGSRPPEGVAGWGWFRVPGVWPRLIGDETQRLLLAPYMEDRTDLATLDQAWYERKVAVPAGWRGRRVCLDFTMLQTHARVFLDGAAAGEIFFPGGEVDVTRHLRPGAEQTLAILVTARPLATESVAFMAPDRVIKSKASVALRGLTGDVLLVSRPAAERLRDVRITTSTRNSAIRVDAKIAGHRGGHRVLRARVLEKGKLAKEFASAPLGGGDLQGGLACVTANWPDAKCWDTHTPQNVYDLVLRLEDGDGKVIDESLPIRFGFREFWIDGRDFYLNGRRIHLRALNVRNINGLADRACLAGGRRTCRRMKRYGFNYFITANYHFKPGGVSYMDGLFDAADAEGVLASFSLPHFRDFGAKLDEPKQAERYRALCEWLIRRVRHHPSIVTYAMNHNATGYRGDQNPLRIDGVFSPEDPRVGGRANRNRTQARIAAKIAKSLDATRPIYHHQSGNLGELHTINIYLNWAPKQERSDWLEHWATKGVKPVFFVEWGLPHISSWSSYRGPNFIWRSDEYQSVWDAEFNAAYLGDAAYRQTPARVKSRQYEEELWARGEPFPWAALIRHFRDDEDNHVAIKAMFADDNWRCLRTWGASAMLPWDQGNLWKKAKGHRGDLRPAAAREPGDLKQPGIVADGVGPSESWIYHPDADQIEPTVLGRSFLRWNRPLCAFVGGEPVFTDKAHNFLPGETVRKQLVILNDTREPVTCTHSSWVLPAGQWDEVRSRGKMPRPQRRGGLEVPPGGRMDVPFDVRLRANTQPGPYEIVAEFDFGPGGRQHDRVTFHVLAPPKKLDLKARIALFDPKGMTAKLLDALGVTYEKVGPDADLAGCKLVVIGREAIGLTTKLPDLSAVRQGLRVLVFEQSADVLTHRLGFRVNVHGLRAVFPRARRHVTTNTVPWQSLRDWRGSGTLVPPHLPIEGVEKDNPRWRWCGFSNTRVWRCGNRGCVASVLIEKPPVGDFRPLLDGGFDLQYAPLLEYVEGAGRVVFCQLDVTARTEGDPGAEAVCRALLADLAGEARTRFAAREKVYHAGGKAGAELLARLGVPLEPLPADAKAPGGLLVVTPGAEPAAVAKRLGNMTAAFALGLAGKEIERLWPGAVQARPQESYGTGDVPTGDAPVMEFLSPAERTWRAKVAFDALDEKGSFQGFIRRGTGKAKPPCDVFLCQVAPWMFDCDKKPYLRTTYRRNVFLVSRLLHNLGAPAKTPLLERLAKPAGRNELVLPAKWVGRPDKEAAGRKAEWWQPGLDEAKWKPIAVPGMFDEQFPGLTPEYNGLFWYRLRFRVPSELATEALVLDLGAIDDESWVWLNGRFLGEVTKKTRPKDYWSYPRKYAMKPGMLKRDGENVLVVLVNDTYLKGGIKGTPLLRAPGAWLTSYYVQQPRPGDDPYRYYRW